MAKKGQEEAPASLVVTTEQMKLGFLGY